MTSMADDEPGTRKYYVDEAGCPTLFGRRGRVVIGEDGCSVHFALGFVEIADPIKIESELQALRTELLADPFFKGVPSMDLNGGKTAIAFHAKDDLPEVRREVFKVILSNEIKFHAEVRNKHSVLSDVAARQEKEDGFRYTEDFLYDSLVSRLFKNHLHKADVDIYFARRGNKPRTNAFKRSIEVAKKNFTSTWGITNDSTVSVTCSHPKDTVQLQVADYCLWALQRYYERRETRFIELLWSKVGCIHDIDDRRKSPTGVYYTKKKPLV